MSTDAQALLMDYDWPGNVRELENIIRFAIVKCKGNIILPEHLPREIRQEKQPPLKQDNNFKLEKTAVAAALKETGGNKVQAAKILRVGRATLYRFLKTHPEI